MGSGKKQAQNVGIFELVDESAHLFRSLPFHVTATYYIGSLPFVLGLLYFWADMSRSSIAYKHCAVWSLWLALLYIWMKTWHTVFAHDCMCRIHEDAYPRWTFRRFMRTLYVQTAIQSTGLFIIPVSMALALPFGWVYAFYQNFTVFGHGDTTNISQIYRKSVKQSNYAPIQNHILIWLMSPWMLMITTVIAFLLLPITKAYSMALGEELTNLIIFSLWFLLILLLMCPMAIAMAVNIGLALIIVPQLLNSLLGIETVFTISGASVFNTTFIAVVIGTTYICLDPLLKVAYVLRCFYGSSITTGEDLRVDLAYINSQRKIITGVIMVLLAVSQPVLCAAAETVPEIHVFEAENTTRAHHHTPSGYIDAGELDGSIDRVLEKPEYTWRQKRLPKPGNQGGIILSFMESLVKSIGKVLAAVGRGIKVIIDYIDDFIDWISDKLHLSPGRVSQRDSQWRDIIHVIMYALIGILVCIMSILIYRMVKERRRSPLTALSEPVESVPDLEDESVKADALPESGWLELAREMMQKGDLRLALRALYLSCLAFLAQRELIILAKFKTDRDYEKELKRKGYSTHEMAALFSDNVSMFERAWYGMHPVTQTDVERFAATQNRIKTYVET